MDLYSDLRAYFLGKVTSLRELQALAGLRDDDAAAFCRVSIETWRRWLSDRPPNHAGIRLLAIRAGLMPWPSWEGWLVRDGRLFPPGWTGTGLLPGEVAAFPITLQLVASLQREIRELRGAYEVELAKARPVVGLDKRISLASHHQLSRISGSASRQGSSYVRAYGRQRKTSPRRRSVRARSVKTIAT